MTDMKIYSRRWGHRNSFGVEKIATGWRIKHLSNSGNCDKTGAPHLYENLNHDTINYPEALGGYLEWLWDKADEINMSEADLQQHLNTLADWVSSTEMASPSGLWLSFK